MLPKSWVNWITIVKQKLKKNYFVSYHRCMFVERKKTVVITSKYKCVSYILLSYIY